MNISSRTTHRFFIPVIVFLSLYFSTTSCSRRTDSLEGIWASGENDTLIIYPLGPVKNSVAVYFVRSNEYASFVLNDTKDSLIRRAAGREPMRFFKVSSSPEFLKDGGTIENRRHGAMYTRVQSIDAGIKTISSGPNDFFDFSTSQFYAGLPYDLTPKAGLPFMINRKFVVQQKLDSLVIEKFEGKRRDGEDVTQKLFDQVFYFDQYGNIEKLKVINPKGYGTSTADPVYWTYEYADAATGNLKSIQVPDRLLTYEDGWEVDHDHRKLVPRPLIVWDNEGDAPEKAAFQNWYADPTIEFVYDDENRLIQRTMIDRSFPEISGFHTYFTYDTNGVLTKVVDIREYKKEE